MNLTVDWCPERMGNRREEDIFVLLVQVCQKNFLWLGNILKENDWHALRQNFDFLEYECENLISNFKLRIQLSVTGILFKVTVYLFNLTNESESILFRLACVRDLHQWREERIFDPWVVLTCWLSKILWAFLVRVFPTAILNHNALLHIF